MQEVGFQKPFEGTFACNGKTGIPATDLVGIVIMQD